MTQFSLPLSLLLVIYISSSKQAAENESLTSFSMSESWYNGDSESLIHKRNLRNQSQSSCLIKNCIKCRQSYKICEACKSNYELQDQSCIFTDQESNISQSMLIGITVSVSLFTILFCIL